MKETTLNTTIQFRKATHSDIERIWEIILQAKAQMSRLNMCQWDENYPAIESIRQDIESENGYVFSLDSRVVAYGVISFDGEPSYKGLEGKWSNELPYMVVHRLAVADEAKQQGMARRFMKQAEEVSRQKGVYNFRVDTNFDNQYMLQLVDTLDFKYRGEVYYRGAPRKAFEKAILPHSYPLNAAGYSIREATYTDAEAIYEAIDKNRNDLRVWLPFVDSLRSIADEQTFLQSILEVAYERRDPAFILEKGKEICGLCGIHFSDFTNHRTEIGYWLLPKYRGLGIVTQAVQYLCEWAVRCKGINRVQIRCATSNEPSNAIPQRLGFKFEGTERDGELLSSGQYTDIHVYSILRSEIEKWLIKSAE